MEHSGSHTGHSESATTYNVNLQAGTAMAGSPCELRFVVTEQRIGEPIDSFQPLHDRLMHLIIVDEMLAYFAHVHPVLSDGTFRLEHVFPSAGRYKLWAEARPEGGDAVLAAFRLSVGAAATGQDVPATSAAGHRVSLTPTQAIPLHSPVELTFDVADPTGSPITDLEPLMAAGGHCVIISSDLRDFLHVHPAEDVAPAWRGGPQIRFVTQFHRPGRYKAWGQFQHRGEEIIAAFDLHVDQERHH